MKRIITLFLISAVLLPSCKTAHFGGKEKLSPADYVQWVENETNGLKIIEKDSIYVYELQYQPIEYLAIRQTRNPQITSSAIKEEQKRRGDYLYFSFKMQNEKGRGILSDKDVEIEDKSSYLLSGLQHDLMLLSGQDTLPCVLLHFESANNLIPYDRCVLAFEKPEKDKADITFLFRSDKYRKGNIAMTVKRENLKRIPTLKTIK